MKKLLFILAAAALLGGLSLRVYFALVPPPKPTLGDLLSDIVPEELNGWKIIDQDMAESPESSERISDFLNFDDALFRISKKAIPSSVFTSHTGCQVRPPTAGRVRTRQTPAGCKTAGRASIANTASLFKMKKPPSSLPNLVSTKKMALLKTFTFGT